VPDILDDSYESDLTDEEHERLILMSEHAIAKPISPAAQAVLDAAMQYEINPECYSREIAATALRAAALHLPCRGSRNLWRSFLRLGDRSRRLDCHC
jgi:siderophore synthetase component